MSEHDDWYNVYYNIKNDYIFVKHVLDAPMIQILLGEVIYVGPL